MRIESQKPVYLGAAILEDEGGEYTLSWQDGWLWNTYFKTYVSGPRAGETVELTWPQWREEQRKRRTKYGYFDWTGEFIEGEVPPVYYSGIPPERSETRLPQFQRMCTSAGNRSLDQGAAAWVARRLGGGACSSFVWLSSPARGCR